MNRKIADTKAASTLQEFPSWDRQKENQTLDEAFKELRRICEEEGYSLEIPPRQERPTFSSMPSTSFLVDTKWNTR